MKRMRILGLALVAVFALAVAAASSASAAPTWFECAKAGKNEKKEYTGTFSDKNCTVSAEHGKYELKEGVGKGKAYKGKQIGGSKLHSKTYLGDLVVECAKGKDVGTAANIAGAGYNVKVTATFSKCEFNGNKCQSAGAKAGEVITKPLAGPLGYISKAGKVVGNDLASEAEPGGALVEFNCTIINVKVVGSMIGLLGKDVNTINKESEVIYAPGEYIGEVEFEGHKWAPLVNIPEFEGGSPDILESEACGKFIEGVLGKECAPATPSGQEQTTVNKGESLEIKA